MRICFRIVLEKMATTFSPVVDHYRRKDGTYRVSLRITHNRQSNYVAPVFYVTKEQITRGFQLKDQMIIDKYDERVKELRQALVKVGYLSEGIDVFHLTELLETQSDKLDFLVFWGEHIKKLVSNGQDGTASVHTYALNHLRKYNNQRPLFFSTITKKYMSQYCESMVGNLSANTINGYIGALKAAYNSAINTYNDDENGIVIVKPGVFKDVKLPRKTKNKSNAMRTVEQMQAIIDVPYTGAWIYDFAKDMYILCFTCFGTNMADFIAMKKDQLKDGILSYRRKKTGRLSGSSVDMQIRLHEVAQIIIDKYSGDPEYLIDFQGRVRKSAYVSTYVHYVFQEAGLEEKSERKRDIGHKKKDTKFTFYSNRHSMASYMRNLLRVDKSTVKELLNHVDGDDTADVDTYLWDDYSILWERNDELLSLFDWSFYLKQKKEA